MSVSTDFDKQVALLLPLYLRGTRERLVDQAKAERDAADRAWPSLRQANWLGEVAARATRVQDIVAHLDKQGERWADKDAQPPRLHQTIARHIGDALRRQILEAMRTTAGKVAEVLGEEAPADYSPSETQVDQEQLKLARLYVGALVAWHRVENRPEE
jgi:hypothetical protein